MRKKILFNCISILAWLSIWLVISLCINKPIFLPTPLETLKALLSLGMNSSFWHSIAFTLLGITKGFLLGLLIGIVFAAISCSNSFIKAFLDLPVKTIKAIPVASFIILALLWSSSEKLSVLISAFMVFPVIYTNLQASIMATDKKQLEMAKVFKLGFFKKIGYVYLPSVSTSLISAISISAGFAWKSGIAAEIIGLVRNSIGNQLYQSKIYLETDNMFAWTITIVFLSIIFEKIITSMIKLLFTRTGVYYDSNK